MTAACAPSRRVAVLDIETVPCADAIGQAHTRSRSGHRRPALHRIVCASVLTACEDADGFRDLDLRTFQDGAMDEAGIVGFVDLALPDPKACARLVTFNGRSSDLPVLRHRACALWMFSVPNLAGWCADAGDHVDLMLDACGRDRDRWSLPDVCAGYGLAIRSGLLARSIHHLHGLGRRDAVVEHNRLDVAGTFLAYAYQRSFQEGRDVFAASAWDGLARLFEGVPTVNAGAATIARHHMVDLARERLAA